MTICGIPENQPSYIVSDDNSIDRAVFSFASQFEGAHMIVTRRGERVLRAIYERGRLHEVAIQRVESYATALDAGERHPGFIMHSSHFRPDGELFIEDTAFLCSDGERVLLRPLKCAWPHAENGPIVHLYTADSPVVKHIGGAYGFSVHEGALRSLDGSPCGSSLVRENRRAFTYDCDKSQSGRDVLCIAGFDRVECSGLSFECVCVAKVLGRREHDGKLSGHAFLFFIDKEGHLVLEQHFMPRGEGLDQECRGIDEDVIEVNGQEWHLIHSVFTDALLGIDVYGAQATEKIDALVAQSLATRI